MKYLLLFVVYFSFFNINFGQETTNKNIERFPVFEACTKDDQDLEYCFENELKKKIKENYKNIEIAYDEAYSETLRFNVEVTRKGDFVPLATDSFNSRTFIAAARAISNLEKVQPALGKNERPFVFVFTLEMTITRPKPLDKQGLEIAIVVGYEHFEDVKNTTF